LTDRAERVRGGNQDADELSQFLDLVRTLNVRRYLEIGCRNGDTFYAVMRVIGPGGYGLAIDIPENGSTKNNLQTTVDDLNCAGITTELKFGESQSQSVINYVRARTPFDLVLIDADHRYDAIKRDFEVYREFGNVIVLHDVAAPRGHISDGHVNGVGTLWNEIKRHYRHHEFVTQGSNMGFGVLYRAQTDKGV